MDFNIFGDYTSKDKVIEKIDVRAELEKLNSYLTKEQIETYETIFDEVLTSKSLTLVDQAFRDNKSCLLGKELYTAQKGRSKQEAVDEGIGNVRTKKELDKRFNDFFGSFGYRPTKQNTIKFLSEKTMIDPIEIQVYFSEFWDKLVLQKTKLRNLKSEYYSLSDDATYYIGRVIIDEKVRAAYFFYREFLVNERKRILGGMALDG